MILDSTICHQAKWHNESKTLGEVLPYPPYTFLINRPLGLIKGKKIVFPNSCKLFTLHLCWWLIKEQKRVGKPRVAVILWVYKEAPVWMPTCEHGWTCFPIQTCSCRTAVFPRHDSFARNGSQVPRPENSKAHSLPHWTVSHSSWTAMEWVRRSQGVAQMEATTNPGVTLTDLLKQDGEERGWGPLPQAALNFISSFFAMAVEK